MKNILVIASILLEKKNILKFLTDIEDSEVEIIQKASVNEGEEILFQTNISLIIIEWSLEGAVEFTYNLKSDEMFRLLPVLAIITAEGSKIKEVFLKGADNYVLINHMDYLPLVVKPLLTTNMINDELMQKTSILQEQAIHDFILLDLIKKYIPLTIWDMANDFAYQQRMHMPEAELELTIAFGDIKEFTRMSQHLPPMDVIRNLNSVFEIVSRIIYKHNGDIDKYIGDAFLAVFEKPLDAIIAMVRVQKEIETLNLNRSSEDKEAILFRIGIHTGPIIRGNVGGDQRFDNTLIGDTVNTAARLTAKAGR